MPPTALTVGTRLGQRVGRSRVAIAGVGEQANAHLIPALLQVPDVRLVAICDPDDARRLATAERLSIRHHYRSVEQLLDDVEVDALIAACPPQAHEQLVDTAIRRHIAVFVEKPPSVTSANLHDLAVRAEAASVLTGVGMNFRHALAYQRLKRLLARPEAGTPIALSVRHVANKPRTPLWGLSLMRSFLLAQAIHPVDLLLDLAGPTVRLHMLHRASVDDVLITVQVGFAGGAIGTLLAGTHAPRFDTRIEVTTDAGLTATLTGLAELTISGSLATERPQASGEPRGWTEQWRPSPLDTGYQRTGFLGELTAFTTALRTGALFRPSLADLEPTYQLLDAIEAG